MLEDCKENIILPVLDGDQLEFEISGLEIMNDDPSDVDVLYGKVKDSSGKLQKIVDSIGNKRIKENRRIIHEMGFSGKIFKQWLDEERI